MTEALARPRPLKDFDRFDSAAQTLAALDPKPANSSTAYPCPKPRRRRPVEIVSTIADSSASFSGWANGASKTYVPTLIRLVRAATAAAIGIRAGR